MAALERPVKAEVSFTDAEGDSIRLAAECQGGRGRVALHHNGAFFKYIKNLVFVNPEGKLYVNGHEATVLLEATGRGALLEKLHDVCRTGKVYFESADSYDAASALAKVRQSEAEQIEDEMEGASAAMIARAKAAALKDPSKKKRVPQPELDKLLGTGVPEARARRAFALCGGATAEAAATWLAEHKDDATLDDPVDASLQPEFYVPLGKEEREAKARELQAKIEAKKAEQREEERKREVDREKKRIETDRTAREMKEAHEKKKRMEAYDLRKREKAEDLRAKAEIRAKINADRVAKGWKPLEDEPAAAEGEGVEATGGGAAAGKKLSAAEFFAKEKQAAAAAAGGAADDWNPMKFAPAGAPDEGAAAAAAAAAAPAAAAQIPSGDGVPLPGQDAAAVAGELAERVAALKAAGSGAVKPLVAYVSNIVGEPFEQKYRTIKTTNKVFERTVLPAPDALRILLLLGFRKASSTDEQGVVTHKLTVSSVHLPTFQAAHKLLSS